MARIPGDRTTFATIGAGALLTLVAAVFPFVDRATTTVLADHIRAGYPTYGPAEINAAATAYLAILSVVGVLGLLGWLGTAWAARAGRGWTGWLATGLFLAAVGTSLAALTVQDTSGDVGLAPLLGWLQVLPCIPGLAAVVLLWRRTS
ncbi:hypothetical protein [Micromonospora sp. NPDC003776]